MVREKPGLVRKQIEKTQEAIYGENDGSPKNTKETLKDVIGNEPDVNNPDGFSIAEEVKNDEEAIADGADNPKDSDIPGAKSILD